MPQNGPKHFVHLVSRIRGEKRLRPGRVDDEKIDDLVFFWRSRAKAQGQHLPRQKESKQ
ncbi:MAG: hypothetical protein AAGL24_16640 [Pseudomonadota bacterium]